MANVKYSCAQMLAMAAMVLGAILVTLGGAAPFWIIFDPQGGGGLTGIIISFTSQVVSANMGVFLYCVEVLGESDCKVYAAYEETKWVLWCRISACICVFFGGLSGLVALFLACCNCCQRFVCLGITSFLAACAGAACGYLFYTNTDVLTTNLLGVQLMSRGWAFYVFCVGAGVLGLFSFVACFASPEQSGGRGVVAPFGQQQQQPTVVVVGTAANNATYPNPGYQGPSAAGPMMGQGPYAGPMMGQGPYTGPMMGQDPYAGPKMGQDPYAGPMMQGPIPGPYSYENPGQAFPGQDQSAIPGQIPVITEKKD